VEEPPIYAIVRAGGRQLRVEPNQTVNIDRIDGDVGSTLNLSVLMVGGNGNVMVGTPEVDGAKVVAEIVEHGRGEKILVFKYKNKTRYRRRQGHRQDYTRIAIKEISAGGKTVTADDEKPKAKARPAKSRASIAEPEAVAEAEPVTAEAAVVEAPTETEAPTKPARTRKAPAKKAVADEPTAEAEATTEAPKKTTRAAKPKAEAKPKATRAKKAEPAAEETPPAEEGAE
jgi:large subunit ribosomal protein L21